MHERKPTQMDRIEHEAAILRRILVAVFRQNDQLLNLVVALATKQDNQAELHAITKTLTKEAAELNAAIAEVIGSEPPTAQPTTPPGA